MPHFVPDVATCDVWQMCCYTGRQRSRTRMYLASFVPRRTGERLWSSTAWIETALQVAVASWVTRSPTSP
jgi:hypothetical protein